MEVEREACWTGVFLLDDVTKIVWVKYAGKIVSNLKCIRPVYRQARHMRAEKWVKLRKSFKSSNNKCHSRCKHIV